MEAFLTDGGYSFDGILQATFWRRLFYKKGNRSNAALSVVLRYFKNLCLKDFRSEKPLPPSEEWGFEQKNNKLRFLAKWLETERGISLSTAISVSPALFKRSLEGCAIPSTRLLKITADYFFLDPRTLLEDARPLPTPDKIVVDEELLAIQKKDFRAEAELNKHRHVIRRSWQILSHGKRLRLILICLAVIIPLTGFTGYCAYTVVQDRTSTLTKFSHDEMSESSKAIAATLTPSNNATVVRMGSQVISVSAIASSNYEMRLSLWFDFDQLQFHRTLCALNPAINYYDVQEFGTLENRWTDDNRYLDHFGWDSQAKTFLNEPNGIPDFIEAADSKNYPVGATKAEQQAYLDSLSLSPIYSSEVSSYPAETVSNNYPNKTAMWSLSGGTFVSDAFNYDLDAPYVKTLASSTDKPAFRLFQKCTFSGKIIKSFDCPRYPLDSEEFNVFITPKQTTDVIRYEASSVISLAPVQQEQGQVYTIAVYGSAEPLAYQAGISSLFNITDGYELISKSAYVSPYVARLSYSGTAKGEAYENVYSSYEIVLRVNRLGFNLFLQAFANLFAVIVWISIAFYDQSYNGEDSIGMLGTGLFGVISSVLVGISMISDANLFSLITMINIFTLCVIMLMAYEAIAAKRAKISKDLSAIAYSTIKLRVLFVLLLICTITIFIGLPLVSYIVF